MVKTGLRDYESKNLCIAPKTKDKEIFKNLILKVNVKYIFLSYNNEGLMTVEDIKEIMSFEVSMEFLSKSIIDLKRTIMKIGIIRQKRPLSIYIMLFVNK